MPFTVSRREFVGRTGLLAGALALGRVAPADMVDRAFAAPPGFTEERRRTYRAVIDAARTAPRSSLRGETTDRAVSQFEQFFSELDPLIQQHIVAVLDVLEQEPSAARFSARSPEAGRVLLRQWIAERSEEERGIEEEFARRAEANIRARQEAGYADIDEYRRGESERIRRVGRAVEQDSSRDIDPQTGVPTYGRTADPDEPRVEPPSPLSSEAARHRYVAGVALQLAAIPFYALDEEFAPDPMPEI